MSILVANIGTSDIAVKIGDRYLPIGFDRQEPNLKEPDKDSPEGAAWHGRWTSLSKMFEEELDISPKAKFREVCQALLAAYRQDPETWHSRISIGRIRGVIDSALAADSQACSSEPITTAYLVVTDQPKTEIFGYPTDTVYAFEIIQAWLSRQEPTLILEDSPKLRLEKSTIAISAINEDLLHEHYYQLFQGFCPDDTIYLSVKGGTAQMQQALKVQALASNTKAQVFLSPKPEISKILAGQPSDCQRVAYWRYQQNQRYQTVQMLLERWDFDGAAVLLQNWEQTLQALVTDDKAELQYQQQKVSQTIKGLQKAVALLNLDIAAADGLTTGDRTLESSLTQFSQPENLYTQCKIYAELKQISHFLSRMGSFYEATQHCLIENLDGKQYMREGQGAAEISVRMLADNAPKLYDLIKTKKSFKQSKEKADPKAWKLGNRYQKHDYIKALIQYKCGEQSLAKFSALSYWQKLDFWYGIRNKVVHRSEGINEDRLDNIYQQRDKKFQIACAYQEILPTMQAILTELKRSDPILDSSTDSQSDITYGPYGQIREWAITTLKNPAD